MESLVYGSMMEEPILKAYYGDIFFEFMLQKKSADAIIILPGLPSSNSSDEILRFFYSKGYHVFSPKYKGTYQSNGKFLKTNIVEDLSAFLDALNTCSAKSLWDGKRLNFRIKEKILLGGSFSGAIACGLAAKRKELSRIILFAPIWNFVKHNEFGDEQDLLFVTGLIRRMYKHLYRFDFKNIQKQLSNVKEIDPSNYLKSLDQPILIFHDPNDKTVSIRHTYQMLKLLKRGQLVAVGYGHALRVKALQKLYPKIDAFLND
jgi:pimeloyl-ACP methyl ester carboxylesterase